MSLESGLPWRKLGMSLEFTPSLGIWCSKAPLCQVLPTPQSWSPATNLSDCNLQKFAVNFKAFFLVIYFRIFFSVKAVTDNILRNKPTLTASNSVAVKRPFLTHLLQLFYTLCYPNILRIQHYESRRSYDLHRNTVTLSSARVLHS